MPQASRRLERSRQTTVNTAPYLGHALRACRDYPLSVRRERGLPELDVATLQGGHQAAIGSVPYSRSMIVAYGKDELSIAGEFRVPQIVAMTLQASRQDAGGGAPHSYGMVITPGYNAAVGQECDVVDRFTVAFERCQELTVRTIPH